MSGTPKDAKRLFLDAIEQYPQDQWPDYLDRIGLALLHDQRGEPEACHQQLRDAMELLRENPDAIQQDRIEAQLLLRELTHALETAEQKQSDPRTASTK